MHRHFSLGKSRIDLTEGPIFKNLMVFTLPILLGAIVTQLYNVTDSIIVGQFVSADALAAVSASSPVMSLINMFLIGLSAGSSVVIAQIKRHIKLAEEVLIRVKIHTDHDLLEHLREFEHFFGIVLSGNRHVRLFTLSGLTPVNGI